MSSAAAAANRAFGIDRGLPFPFEDIAARRRRPAGRQQPGRHDAAGHAVLRRAGGERGARHIVVDPRRTATAAAGATCTCSRVPGTDLALANGMLHIAIRDGLVDEAYIADRTTGLRRGPPRGPLRTGPTGSSGSPASPVAELTRGRAQRWPPARTAMILTARGAEQHADGTDTATAWINLALALGLPGAAGLRATARSPGRATGRAGASTGRRPTSCPATGKLADPADRAHVAGVWGIDPDELPGPGRLRLRDARPPGHRRRGAGAAASPRPTRWCRRRTPRHVAERLDALDFLVVTDFFLSETAARGRRRAAHRPVGRGGRHDDQPGGPGPAAPPGRRRRRRGAHRPGDAARLADRLGRGAVLPDRPAPTVFDELRRASAGGDRRLRRASPTSGSTPSEQLFWPCPDRGPPRHAAAVPRRVPDAGRAGPLRRGRPPRAAAERPDAEYPYLLTTGRSCSTTSPAPRPAAARRCSAAEPERLRRAAPGAGPRGSASPTASLVRLRTRARAARCSGPGSPTGIRRDTVFVAVPLGRRRRGQRADQSARSTRRLADARVQDLRRGRRTAPSRTPARRDRHRLMPTPRRRHAQHAASSRASSPSRARGWTSRRCCTTASPTRCRPGSTTQPLYFRGGNSHRRAGHGRAGPRRRADAVLPDRREGATLHVALRGGRGHRGGTVLELQLAAPEGLTGTVVVDLGLVEV